jgi:putative transposase
MIVTRTEKICLKTSKTLFRLCNLAKNLYNEGNYLIRQEFFKNGKWIRYYSLYHLLKNSENYSQLPAQTAQQVLKLLDRSWTSFFRAIKAYKTDKSKFLCKPRLPHYKPKKEEFLVIFTNQQVKLQAKILRFPKKIGLEVKTRLNDDTDIREVRIIPKGVGYILEIIYHKEFVPKPLNKENLIAIDLGVSNLITAVNNNGLKPFVIKGGTIKSMNQYYNKKKARIQSTYDQQGIKIGKTKQKLTYKHNKKISDYFHKISKKIIDYCMNNDIGTVVIGYNPEWKQSIRIGKRNTQNFVTIPYYKLIQMLEYKKKAILVNVLS